MQYNTIVNPNFHVLMEDFQNLIREGWEIDPNSPPEASFINYAVHLVREDAVQVVHAEAMPAQEQPKKPIGRPARKENN